MAFLSRAHDYYPKQRFSESSAASQTEPQTTALISFETTAPNSVSVTP